MDLYNLGVTTWQDSQIIYHALAHLGREALCIVEPGTPYVCLGYHQDAAKELDMDFVEREQISVIRREVGGGAVYLDRGQLFYQFVFHKGNPAVPQGKETFYRKFLQPVIDTFNAFGVAATFKPVNDIVVYGRKISGNGAAEIEDTAVLVGNFIVGFNYEMMSKVLKVPDEKFRDKVYKTLSENLTTIEREIGRAPTYDELTAELVRRCKPLLGPLTPRDIDAELRAKADELLAAYTQREWIFQNDLRVRHGTQIKIAEEVYVIQKMVKVAGGLIRASAVSKQGRLSDVHLSGDFFFYPARRLADLEQALEGIEARPEAVAAVIRQFYAQFNVEAPGVRPEDFAGVLSVS